MTEDNNVHGERKGKAVLVDKQVNKLQLEVVLVDNEKINLVLYQYKDGVQDLIAIKTRANYWAGIINGAVKELPHAVKQMPNSMR
jgi:DNA/RNA-binding domain of Phe-tRNA-synthetase-like protein